MPGSARSFGESGASSLLSNGGHEHAELRQKLPQTSPESQKIPSISLQGEAMASNLGDFRRVRLKPQKAGLSRAVSQEDSAGLPAPNISDRKTVEGEKVWSGLQAGERPRVPPSKSWTGGPWPDPAGLFSVPDGALQLEPAASQVLPAQLRLGRAGWQ